MQVPALVRQAVDFIESRLTESISVADVCEIGPGSPWEFQRVFRLYTGDSIGDYIRGRRLSEVAKEIAANPNLRLLDLAIKYQFGSQEAFTRSFKRRFGMTPGQARSANSEIRLTQKAKLSEEQLDHNLKGIQREPRIVTLPNRIYVGIGAMITSPFSEETSFIDPVSNLWLEFNPRRKEIANRVPGIGYGLVMSPSLQMIEDQFPYFGAVEVTEHPENLPDGMDLISIPAKTYAYFEKRGLADKTKMSLDYIYGFWLPQSSFERAEGYDMEIYDHRLRLDRPDSISIYCIPVRPKT